MNVIRELPNDEIAMSDVNVDANEERHFGVVVAGTKLTISDCALVWMRLVGAGAEIEAGNGTNIYISRTTEDCANEPVIVIATPTTNVFLGDEIKDGYVRVQYQKGQEASLLSKLLQREEDFELSWELEHGLRGYIQLISMFGRKGHLSTVLQSVVLNAALGGSEFLQRVNRTSEFITRMDAFTSSEPIDYISVRLYNYANILQQKYENDIIEIEHVKEGENQSKEVGTVVDISEATICLTNEDTRKLKLVRDIEFEELQALIEKERSRVEFRRVLLQGEGEIPVITPEDLRTRGGRLLTEVSEGSCFLIRRKNTEMAVLMPPTQGADSVDGKITATEFNSNRGKCLDRALNGEVSMIERDGERVAILAPPPAGKEGELSAEQRVKLSMIDNIPTNMIEKIVAILRGKISLVDLLSGD